MRILHTADWHVGKKLGRIDRLPEAEAVLDEVVGIARDARADIVIVAGDLFDRSLPPFAVMGLVFDTLQRLRDTGATVVAVPGNHDSAELFRLLAPYVRPKIVLSHKPMAPADGGVVKVPSRDGSETAQIALVPFLHESQTVDFMDATEDWYKSYADRIRRINLHYAHWMVEHGGADTIDVLVGHFMVDGAVPSGSERALHIGDAFMASAQSIPADIKYAALGHIHKSQRAPASAVPAYYSGSLMQLDFGESGQDKFVLLVEASPHRPANIEPIPIKSGRKLLYVSGTIEEIAARAGEFGDAILDVAVTTDGPVPQLADEVRALLPDALYVRAEYERAQTQTTEREGLGLDEVYAEYFRHREGTEPSSELLAALNEVCTTAGVQW